MVRPGRAARFDTLTGTSQRMLEIYEKIRVVADTNVPVLLLGESGTGKELVARATHRRSERADGPFVAVNTGAISPELVYSELFGHVKGAFTGAFESRKGRFEQAEGGTLFLDEIGTMEERTQVALLRVLESHAVQRVGGKRNRRVDVRLICASNEDLLQDMEKGRLTIREDLFHRLNVFIIQLPPLRERVEDLPLLAEEFLRMYADRFEKELDGFTPDALDALGEYSWPGNVRELKNAIQRAALLAEGMVTLGDLPERIQRFGDTARVIRIPLGSSMQAIEQTAIQETLRYTDGNKSKAAELLGITRKTLYDKIRRYDISDVRMDPAAETA